MSRRNSTWFSALEKRQEEYNERAKAWYEKYLRSMLGNRQKENKFLWTMAGLFVLSLLLPITGLVKVVFFPAEDMDFVTIAIELVLIA